jgi:branched-chain amino acid transport system permease protein
MAFSGPLNQFSSPFVAVPVLGAAIAFPLLATAIDQPFYISFATRLIIFGIAASSLNLVLGFGGMVSFGHAAFLGIGAYVVGILMLYGIASAWLAWPAAILFAAVAACAIGAISLRTRGVYFIMITLAFAQMLYYVAISLRQFGGDDGLSLPGRSTLGGAIDLTDDMTFYYVVLAIAVCLMVFMLRLVNSRFGRVIQAIRENEIRMEAIGFPVFRYKLACFVIAGAMAGIAGALIANQNGIVSPSLMYWTQSGTLMIMVIIGGVGYLYGGFIGAIVLLLLEETLSSYTSHWQLPLGILLLAVVLFTPNGLASVWRRNG